MLRSSRWEHFKSVFAEFSFAARLTVIQNRHFQRMAVGLGLWLNLLIIILVWLRCHEVRTFEWRKVIFACPEDLFGVNTMWATFNAEVRITSKHIFHQSQILKRFLFCLVSEDFVLLSYLICDFVLWDWVELPTYGLIAWVILILVPDWVLTECFQALCFVGALADFVIVWFVRLW